MKSFLLRIFIAVVITATSLESFAQSDVRQDVSAIHKKWLKEALHLTKNCVGFSAPVSSRALTYLTIGMYESSVEIMDSLISLDEQLNDYQRTVWSNDTDFLNWELVANSADFTLISYLYRNMPPKNRKQINQINDSITSIYGRTDSSSIEYRALIAEEIIN